MKTKSDVPGLPLCQRSSMGNNGAEDCFRACCCRRSQCCLAASMFLRAAADVAGAKSLSASKVGRTTYSRKVSWLLGTSTLCRSHKGDTASPSALSRSPCSITKRGPQPSLLQTHACTSRIAQARQLRMSSE